MEARRLGAPGIQAVMLEEVDPTRAVEWKQTMRAGNDVKEISIHLLDGERKDRCELVAAMILQGQ